MTYSEKLKDPRWQRRRQDAFDFHGQRCCKCQRHTTELHVHHINYSPGREPWDYTNAELAVLCYDCHKRTEREIREYRSDLFKVGPDTLLALGVARDILMAKQPYALGYAELLERAVYRLKANAEEEKK
jgi:hypothetical protein